MYIFFYNIYKMYILIFINNTYMIHIDIYLLYILCFILKQIWNKR